MNNPTFAYINVNSIRYKHADLFAVINSNIDVLSIAETKLDSSFLSMNIRNLIVRIEMYMAGGLLVYVKQDNPSRPSSVSDSAFCEKISGTIDFYSQKCCVDGRL